MGYSFPLATSYFYKHHPTNRIVHTTAFVTSVVPSCHERTLYHRATYRSSLFDFIILNSDTTKAVVLIETYLSNKNIIPVSGDFQLSLQPA